MQRRPSPDLHQPAQRGPSSGVPEYLHPAVLHPAQHGVLQRPQAALYPHPPEELQAGAEGAVHHRLQAGVQEGSETAV